MSFIDLIRLCRPQQWYKNLVIFIALFFKERLFDVPSFLIVLVGFFALSFTSSANYIINDFFDRPNDRLNPEKKQRPLASGRISTFAAFTLAFVLFLVSLWLAFWLNPYFFAAVLSLFVLSTLYTLFFKHQPLLDIIIISINFVLRAVSGTFIINVDISPWLIIGTFFLSIFVSLEKRLAEIILFRGEKTNLRKTLAFYDSALTMPLLVSTGAILIVCFALYSFLSAHPQIIFVLPIFVYLIYRYLYLLEEKPAIPRNPERVLFDAPFFSAFILLGLAVFLLVYTFP